MRTVIGLAALFVVSIVPASAQQQTTPPPPATSSQRPSPAATAPPPPPTTRPSAAQPRTLPPTPSRPAPSVAVPAVEFAPQSGPTTPAPPRPATSGQNAPAAAASPQATSWQNVRLEIKISDSLNPGSAENVKTVSMLILDGRSGQVRSTSDNGLINVDARPTIRPDGRIYLQLTMEYRPDLTPQQRQANSQISMYNESLNLVVADGKSIVASQSADPRSDRKVVVEITATVIK